MGAARSGRTPPGPVPAPSAHHPSPGQKKGIIEGIFRLAAPIRPVLEPAPARRQYVARRAFPLLGQALIRGLPVI